MKILKRGKAGSRKNDNMLSKCIEEIERLEAQGTKQKKELTDLWNELRVKCPYAFAGNIYE